jgi:hypothetical protein
MAAQRGHLHRLLGVARVESEVLEIDAVSATEANRACFWGCWVLISIKYSTPATKTPGAAGKVGNLDCGDEHSPFQNLHCGDADQDQSPQLACASNSVARTARNSSASARVAGHSRKRFHPRKRESTAGRKGRRSRRRRTECQQGPVVK